MKKSNPVINITQPVIYILLVLSIHSSHGYEIIKKVSQYSDNQVVMGPGTLYGALKRMLAAGLIEELKSTEGTETTRRFYKITNKGAKQLNKELARFSKILLLKNKHKDLTLFRKDYES